MRSAPTLKIWITPLASVAMLEKLALLKIALCNALALRNVPGRPELRRPCCGSAGSTWLRSSRSSMDLPGDMSTSGCRITGVTPRHAVTRQRRSPQGGAWGTGRLFDNERIVNARPRAEDFPYAALAEARVAICLNRYMAASAALTSDS